MNAALVVAFLRQRLGSPMRLVMLLFVFFSSFMIVAATKQIGTLDGAPLMFALVLAAGAIGQEVSSGTLTLTFARPVTRATYVLSRWAGAAGFATALGWVLIAAGLMTIAARGGPLPEGAEVAALALGAALSAAAAAAVMIMLSSFANGLGDVALWALGTISGGLAGMLGQAKRWPVLVRAASELDLTLSPKPHLGWLFGAGDRQVYELLAVLSATAVALAVAVWLVNRKELSYAAG